MSYLPEKSKLFIVATPIGHMSDISPRAVDTLRHAQIVFAEDTRTAQGLFAKIGVKGPRVESYHEHSDGERRAEIVRKLAETPQNAVLISDAGTPCISDPGYKLVREVREAGIEVVSIPGPSAVLTLAAGSGLPTDRLLFIGFLPHKESAVKQEFAGWGKYENHSIVFFDSLRRLQRDLRILAGFFPKVHVAVGRELTKMHEETLLAEIDEVIDWLESKETLKGEVSVMVHLGRALQELDLGGVREEILTKSQQRFAEGARLKELLREFKDHGLGRAELYDLLLAAKAENK